MLQGLQALDPGPFELQVSQVREPVKVAETRRW